MSLIICVLEIVYLFLWMESGNNIFFFVALGIFLWWIIERREEEKRYQEKSKRIRLKSWNEFPITEELYQKIVYQLFC